MDEFVRGAGRGRIDEFLNPAATIEGRCFMATGVITSLRPGGFGFVASDACTIPTKLQFRREAVEADGFDHLREGQRIRFERVPMPGDPARYRAVRVSPLD